MSKTDERFWNCECKDHYIHNKEKERVCPYCYAMTQDRPDSTSSETKKKENLFDER